MREAIILITGANGEVGRGLIEHFATQPNAPQLVTLDLNPLASDLLPLVREHFTANILDANLLNTIQAQYNIDTIFHLAAVLSTTGEKNPKLAHDVNVNGMVNLLEMAIAASQQRGESVKFIYPSSIAVYGLPDLATKQSHGAVHEDEFLNPTTMYGANKLYCEQLGRYYSNHYMQLADNERIGIDFRGVRFPGLISAHTVPSGGTSDFAPEMIHAAVQGKSYACFVRDDSTLPFMVMPDAITALIKLSDAPRASLTRHMYNVTSFSLSAGDVRDLVCDECPTADITFAPTTGRQSIVDTWAANVDDRAARADWGWQPAYDVQSAFHEYLFHHIRERYAAIELS